MIRVIDTNLASAEMANEIINLPYKCTRVDVPPSENNPNVEYAGMYWTHQFYNFCPVSDPTFFQNAGLEGSENPLWKDILAYLEATIPEMPPRENLYSSYINVLRYGNSPGIHVDAPYFVEDNQTVLVYLNPVWDPQWGGETIFFDEDLDAREIVQPRPGRVLIFDGRIPHTGRPPEPKFMFNRYIIAYKYMDMETRQKLFDEYEMSMKPPVEDRGIAGFDPNTVKEIWRSLDITRRSDMIK